MKHFVEHDLDQPTAKRAAEKAWESYSQRFAKYEPRIQWKDDTHADVSFKAKGIHLSGTLDLEPRRIGLELEVPLLLRMFKKQAVEVIDQEIRKWVAKAKAGEI